MNKKKEVSDTYKSYIKTSAVGLEIGLSIVVGALAGYLFDGYFDTRPYGLLFGFLVGALAAAKRLYMFSKQYLKENSEDDRQKPPDA